jgi:peptide/nickel transport system ATP-binding protein
MTAESISVGAEPVLSVRDLVVHFPTEDGLVKAVDGVSFDVLPGQTLGIVGESGSGKSVTSLAIMGLHRNTRAKVSGSIMLGGVDLNKVSSEELRRRRGRDVAMIFQDPLSALHPYYTIGNQIGEAYLVHHRGKKAEARARTLEMLGLVGIPNPRVRIDQYPHEFSGGMRQRAMIAMALVNDPQVLIADEPTNALDVTVQAQILELMKDLQRQMGSSIIMITHDLGVVAHMAHDILVMYAGRQVENGTVNAIFDDPLHPYTSGLLHSMPRLDQVRNERLDPIPGSPPSLINLPGGCAFHPRCLHETEVPDQRCRRDEPALLSVAGERQVRCHLYDADGPRAIIDRDAPAGESASGTAGEEQE